MCPSYKFKMSANSDWDMDDLIRSLAISSSVREEKVIEEKVREEKTSPRVHRRKREREEEPDQLMDDGEGENIKKDFYEVRKIINHEVSPDGKWWFVVEFKGGTHEWVLDEDTNCEDLISSYLHEKGIKTVHFFCRVSTGVQAGEFKISLDAQEAQLRSQVAVGSTDRIKVHRIACSAYKGVPAKLQKIAQACKSGDTIAVYRIDRLSRNIFLILDLLKDLNKRGVEIFSHDENLWYRKNSLEFVQKILEAQRESENIGKRIRMSLQHRRSRGDQVFGSVKYGFSTTRNSQGQIVKIPCLKEREIINEILRLSGGPRIIAAKLNSEGKLKRGRKWTSQMVTRIIKEYK